MAPAAHGRTTITRKKPCFRSRSRGQQPESVLLPIFSKPEDSGFPMWQVRMRRHAVAADPLAVIVSWSLLALVVCNAALASWGAAPAKVADILPAPAFLPGGDSIRIVLVVDAAARPGSGALPRIGARTAEVLRVNWADAARGRSDPAENSLASLIKTYGYSQLPLLLTFDKAGHVLRVKTPQTSSPEGADDR